MAQPQVLKVDETAGLPLADLGALTGSCTLSDHEEAAWRDLYPLVAGLVSDSLIVSLSRPRDKDLGGFHFTPGDATAVALYGCNERYKVYLSTLARLPSALPSVDRYLQAYIVGLNEGSEFLANTIILTIRGERRE